MVKKKGWMAMLKKIFTLCLALCLLCGCLSACNQTTTERSPETTMETTPKNHPGNDDTLSILMVGNSFCYYYVEELYGMLIANPDPNRGYEKVRILNLYYSGCRLDQHLNWWKNGLANYQLFQTDENGRVEMEPAKQWTLEAMDEKEHGLVGSYVALKAKKRERSVRADLDASEGVLLPVYRYEYKGFGNHKIYMNGTSGRMSGDAPCDKGKVLLHYLIEAVCTVVSAAAVIGIVGVLR
jgi:hypothetical protein